jgi:hypothetical protein
VFVCVCVDGDGQLKKDEGNGPPFHPSLTVVIKRASKQLHLAKFTTVKGVNRVVKLVFLFYFSLIRTQVLMYMGRRGEYRSKTSTSIGSLHIS